jgi:Protein of unknown function (DUF2475)
MAASTATSFQGAPGSHVIRRTPFSMDYLPGYTGHIPYKKEIYGCTMGDINKIVMGKTTSKVSNFEVDHANGYMSSMPTKHDPSQLATTGNAHATRTLYSKPPLKDEHGLQKQYGNFSRKGDNWIGGPTANAKAQHVPGYQGYVPSIKAENLYAHTYGKATAIAINKDYPRDPGIGKPPIGSGVDRYRTQAAADFSKDNFRRIREVKEAPADHIDKHDANNFNDEE